jgi:prepilin-type N-terminal cleavage/methylation domain-containing protein
MPLSRLRQENGFTLMELLIATTLTTVILGSAVALSSQIQNGYRRQLEDSAGEQEARYAIEWISRYLRGAGNNPKSADTSDCTVANPDFIGLIIDPNGDGEDDDITLQMDSNPPDGVIGGVSPDCTQANEQVTISFCSEAEFAGGDCTGANTIEFLDEVIGGVATTRTDNVIDGLQFVYLRSDGVTETAISGEVFYVRVQIVTRTRTINAASGNADTRTLATTVRVRNR